MTTLFEAALAYTEQGLAVFPCGPSKAPLIRGGFHAASAEPEQIALWWTTWPDAWIGLPTGALNGITVLDVDPRNGGGDALDGLLALHGPDWFMTHTSQTPSGGLHLRFRHDQSITVTAIGLLPGLDLKDEGGYVIAAPSPGYPVTVDAPMRDQPEWLLALRRAKQAPTAVFRSSQRDDRLLDAEALEGVSEAVSAYWSNGTRHYLCRAITGYLLNAGLPPEQVAAVLKTVLSRAADDEARCRLRAAQAVADRAEAGLPVPGAGWLSVNLPELLEKLDALTGRGTRFLSLSELFGTDAQDAPDTPEDTVAAQDAPGDAPSRGGALSLVQPASKSPASPLEAQDCQEDVL